jgi:hypothetical protein
MADPTPSSAQMNPEEKGRAGVKADHTSPYQEGRRNFLKDALVAGGGALASLGAVAPAVARAAEPSKGVASPKYHYVPVSADTVHWGYFSKLLSSRWTREISSPSKL